MSETNISVPDSALSAAHCKGLTDVLATIGDKWTIKVVGTLSEGPLRYNEIERRVGGISQRMLTLTLKRLEVDGIVTRTLFPSVPPRVDYELTHLGQTLRGALSPLHLWAVQNKETIEVNRRQAAAKGENCGPTESSNERESV
ncbi:MAG: winged helix-turn-helix transcriptional regulator [Janthinobacterium lividum]